MPETLLSTSAVLLYGRKVLDLQLVQQATATIPGTTEPCPDPIDTHPQGLGANDFLRKQLDDQETGRPPPTLARIYAFSYDGHYYDLPSPAIFLVHGDGKPAETRVPNSRQSVAPESANNTGVATQSYSFSKDMQVWSYDKGDFSLRMDIETGTLEQILLGLEARSQYHSGADVRVRGADVKGADVRGADVRARGNRRD